VYERKREVWCRSDGSGCRDGGRGAGVAGCISSSRERAGRGQPVRGRKRKRKRRPARRQGRREDGDRWTERNGSARAYVTVRVTATRERTAEQELRSPWHTAIAVWIDVWVSGGVALRRGSWIAGRIGWLARGSGS
jgi:hypothetical protein